MEPEITTYKMRPVFLQTPDVDDPAKLIVPEHAKHLEPSCTSGSPFQSASRSALPLSDPRSRKPLRPQDMPWLPPLTVYVSLT
jgi:hypothetical protein